eukprot:474589_1
MQNREDNVAAVALEMQNREDNVAAVALEAQKGEDNVTHDALDRHEQIHKASYQFIGKQKEKKPWYHSAIWCYRDDIWYWELIIFIRRLLLSFALIVYDSDDLRMYTIFGLLIYCVIHNLCKPFKFEFANHFELYLLISTITMIALDIHYRNTPHNIHGVTLMSMLMFLPIFWVIYFAVSRAPFIKKGQSLQEMHSEPEIELQGVTTDSTEDDSTSPNTSIVSFAAPTTDSAEDDPSMSEVSA